MTDHLVVNENTEDKHLFITHEDRTYCINYIRESGAVKFTDIWDNEDTSRDIPNEVIDYLEDIDQKEF